MDRKNEFEKRINMKNTIEFSLAAAGAAGGLIFGGPTGAAIGAVGGGLIGIMGVGNLRSSAGPPSVIISKEAKKELETILHIAIAASWGLRPHIEADPYIQREIVRSLYGAVVENYTSEVTPYTQEMHLHLARVVMTGIKPEDSLRYVKRHYAPGFLKKSENVSFLIGKHVLQAMTPFGPFAEAKAWYLRWCEEIGIKKYGEATWIEHFGETEVPTYIEWKKARRSQAMETYFAEEP